MFFSIIWSLPYMLSESIIVLCIFEKKMEFYLIFLYYFMKERNSERKEICTRLYWVNIVCCYISSYLLDFMTDVPCMIIEMTAKWNWHSNSIVCLLQNYICNIFIKKNIYFVFILCKERCFSSYIYLHGLVCSLQGFLDY